MRSGGTREGRGSPSLLRDQHHRLTALLQISAASRGSGIPTTEVGEITIQVPLWDHKDLERTQLQKPLN